MAAKNVNFKYYTYTDDKGGTWSCKVSKLVGDNADFGFGAADTSKPLITAKGQTHMRALVWIDPNTGRTTSTPVGSLTAAIWVDPSTGFTGYGKDTTTDIVYSFVREQKERVRRGSTIVNKPEPA